MRFLVLQQSCHLLILGGADLEYAASLPGYTTGLSYAHSGNKLNDIQNSLPLITCQPQTILLGSPGLEDISPIQSNQAITESGKALLSNLKSKWPLSKIAIIGIHPVLDSFIDYNRGLINAEIRAVNSGCWVHPDNFFLPFDGNYPSPSDFVSPIVYNSRLAFLIRDSVIKTCHVQL